jgi:uncharacterized protein
VFDRRLPLDFKSMDYIALRRGSGIGVGLEMMHFLGYVLALASGLSLGLMGSGGSILTVPVLVYLFRINPVLATSYSLFVVGVTSLIGFSTRLRGRHVDLQATLAFAIPSLATVFLVRKYLVHELSKVLILRILLMVKI